MLKSVDYELVDLLTAGRAPQLRSALMESLAERFMRQIAFSLLQRMRQSVQLASCANAVISHDAALSTVPAVMLAAIVDLSPLRGRMMIVIDAALIGAVVDAMCGASDPDGDARAELSVMEVRIGKQLIDLTMTSMAQVFGGLTRLNWSIVQFETRTGMLAVADGQDWMISATGIFDTAVGSGSIRVIAPMSAFEPLEARAASPSAIAGRGAGDRDWQRSLNRLTEATPVELRVELVRTQVPLGEITRLRMGAVMPCKILPNAIAAIGAIDVFFVDYGQQDGFACCRPKPDPQQGANMAEPKDAAAEPERMELEKLKTLPRNSPALASNALVERVPVLLTVELGRTSIAVKELRSLRHGQVVMLDQMAGEPLSIFANGQRLGAGEVVAVGRDQYGIRITSLADANDGTEDEAA